MLVDVRVCGCSNAIRRSGRLAEGSLAVRGMCLAFVLSKRPNHGAAKVGGKKTQALIVAATLLRKSYAFAFEAKQK